MSRRCRLPARWSQASIPHGFVQLLETLGWPLKKWERPLTPGPSPSRGEGSPLPTCWLVSPLSHDGVLDKAGVRGRPHFFKGHLGRPPILTKPPGLIVCRCPDSWRDTTDQGCTQTQAYKPKTSKRGTKRRRDELAIHRVSVEASGSQRRGACALWDGRTVGAEQHGAQRRRSASCSRSGHQRPHRSAHLVVSAEYLVLPSELWFPLLSAVPVPEGVRPPAVVRARAERGGADH